MLTILHPHLLSVIQSFPAGLLVLMPEKAERPVLIVKGMKEAILAARIQGNFAVYVTPVKVGSVDSIGLITAFFDDPDEPLVVRSPLFAEDAHSRHLVNFLQASESDVHFFDEHAREMLAYRAEISLPAVTRNRLEQAQFGRFTHDIWRSVDDQMQSWFSERTETDDSAAVIVQLVESLMPDDIALIDATVTNNSYVGASPVTSTFLVRQEPGPLQEHDIALLLQRIFSPEQIIRGPLRVSDREEVADILVVTEDHLIFIQAKDSPNTEQILANSLSRKRATALKSLNKAIAQLRGAIRYARRQNPMPVVIAGREQSLQVAGLHWRTIAVVKELFNDEFASYSPPILQLGKETGVPSIALDYSELNMYTANLSCEESFVAAIDKVFNVGRERGELPRLRIGPAEAL
jgi:hypothetical protein